MGPRSSELQFEPRARGQRPLHKARVVGKLELTNPVRLEPVSAPDAMNRTHAEPRRLRHQGSGPMGRFPRWFAERQRDDALRCLRTQRFDAERPSLIAKQTLEPLLHKTFLPAPNVRLGLAGLTRDLVRADAIGGQLHDFGSPNVLLRRVAVFNEGLIRRASAEEMVTDFPARMA